MNKEDALRQLLNYLAMIDAHDDFTPELLALIAGSGTEADVFRLLVMRLTMLKALGIMLSSIRSSRTSAAGFTVCTWREKALICASCMHFWRINPRFFCSRFMNAQASVRRTIPATFRRLRNVCAKRRRNFNMSQGMNDLLTSLSVSLSAEEVAFNGLCGVICGEIVAQRVKRNMSQKQFAEFMGVSQGMVSKWERGDCNFTLQSLVHIATKLDIPVRSPFGTPRSARPTSGKVADFPGKWNTLSSHTPDFESVDLKEM